MKILIIILLFIANTINVLGNNFASEYDSSQTVKESIMIINNNDCGRMFEVNSDEDGEYYINIWALGSMSYGRLNEYYLKINDDSTLYTFKATINDWHNIPISNDKNESCKVAIHKGINKLYIYSRTSDIPEVDIIKISKHEKESKISDKKYLNYKKSIADNLSDNRNSLTMFQDSSSNTPLSNSDDPDYMIYNQLNVPIYYTTYKAFIFSKDQKVHIESTSITNNLFCLELFSINEPANNSWSIVSDYIETKQTKAILEVTIPKTDVYYLRIRSWRQYERFAANININNGQFTFYNCPVASTGISVSGYYGTNYFTCHTTSGADPILWYEQGERYIPGPGQIRAYNDNYIGTGDYNWKNNARLDIPYLQKPSAMLISAKSSNDPEGVCNIYGGVAYSDYTSMFPKLKHNDALKSGAASHIYNSVSHSIGNNSYWEWPADPLSGYWTGNAYDSFISYYEGKGSLKHTYAKDSAVVIIWGNSYVDLYHASVTNYPFRGNTNSNHGYSWESKIGTGEVLMHTRDALEGDVFGKPQIYFKLKDYAPAKYSSYEADKYSLEKANNSQLIDDIKELLEEFNDNISSDIIYSFEIKYNNWKQTWKNSNVCIHSNPRKYAESNEYNELLNYCSTIGKVAWPLIIKKFTTGDLFTSNLIKDLTLSSHTKLVYKIRETSKKSLSNYIPSLYHNYLNYSYELLNLEFNNIKSGLDNINNKDDESIEIFVNSDYSHIYIDINSINKSSNIAINIYDIYGNLKINNNIQSQNNKKIEIDRTFLKSGVYLINITIDNKSINKKINLN